jgi:hypothetical protein
MSKFTIVYTDGYEEHYEVIRNNHPEAGMRMQHFNQIIENDMLKLVIEESQLVLIPIANIRKIITQPTEELQEFSQTAPGFIHVKVAEL